MGENRVRVIDANDCVQKKSPVTEEARKLETQENAKIEWTKNGRNTTKNYFL